MQSEGYIGVQLRPWKEEKEILENCGGNMSGGSVGSSEEGNLNTVMEDEKEAWPAIQRPLLRE